jgi:hypothetical protein
MSGLLAVTHLGKNPSELFGVPQQPERSRHTGYPVALRGEAARASAPLEWPRCRRDSHKRAEDAKKGDGVSSTQNRLVLKRMLVATDFSRPAEIALRRAAQIAGEQGATLSLLHVA